MKDGLGAVIALVIAALVVTIALSIVFEANSCWSNDGKMAQGLSWNGYFCAESNE